MGPDDLHIAIKFFCIFARFEHALKAAGYLTDRRRTETQRRKAEAEWSSYFRERDGNAYLEQLRTRPTTREACAYFIAQPPLVQFVEGEDLQWRPNTDTYPTPLRTAEHLSLALRALRNNLFHGGKELARNDAEVKRNRDLFLHAITLLEAFIEDDPKLQPHYHGELGANSWASIMRRVEAWGVVHSGQRSQG